MALTPKTKDEYGRPKGAIPRARAAGRVEQAKDWVRSELERSDTREQPSLATPAAAARPAGTRGSNIRYAANTFSAQRSVADMWTDGKLTDGSISGGIFRGSKIQRPGGPEVRAEQAGQQDAAKTRAAAEAASRLAGGATTGSLAAPPIPVGQVEPTDDDPFSGEGAPPGMTLATLQQFSAGDELLMQAGAQAQAALTAAGNIDSFNTMDTSLPVGYQQLFSFNQGDSPFETQIPSKKPRAQRYGGF